MRSVLYFLVVVCPAGAVDPADADKKQNRAVAALEDLGAKIERVSKKPGSPVIAVICHTGFIDDGDLGWLRFFPKLEKLDLHNGRTSDQGPGGITDRGLGALKEINPKNLRHLIVSATNVTDDGLANLKNMSQLEHLDLRNTKVTSEGVKKLKKALPKAKILGP